MEKLKAGYVSFGTMFYEPENLKKISITAEKQLEAAEIELVRTDPVFGEGDEPVRAIKELKKGEWDFLIANIINWVDMRGVMRVLRACQVKRKLLMTATFRGILHELFESAEIDGCNYFQKIRHVVLPMGRAAIFLTIIFYFIMSWNDLFTPLIFLQSMDKQTVMVALAGLMGRYQGSPTLQFAGLLLGAIPALIIYILFQKQIIGGLTVGALK